MREILAWTLAATLIACVEPNPDFRPAAAERPADDAAVAAPDGTFAGEDARRRPMDARPPDAGPPDAAPTDAAPTDAAPPPTDLAPPPTDLAPPPDQGPVPDAHRPPDAAPPGDADGDGVPDAIDNCPAHANPEQQDADGDALGDACDVCPEVPLGAAGHVDADADGFPPCAGDCDDARADRAPGQAERCDAVDNDCDGEIDEGLPPACGALRRSVMLCGGSDRPVQTFLRGPVAGLEVRAGCEPGDDVQALLVTRTGGPRLAGGPLRAYVAGGGQVLTEYDIGHLVFNLVFGTVLSPGQRLGSCRDNVQPVVQHSPSDPFWRQIAFAPVSRADSGCGHDVRHFPNITPLGGWSFGQVSLAYRDLGQGRVWLVEADWQDAGEYFTEASADLMAAMIGGRFPARPDRAACADGADNDADGQIDAFDLGCEGPNDDDETDAPNGVLPACADRQDNDRDGRPDFPGDPGCGARGDPDEADGPVPACANARDDDADGRADFPLDPGCDSAGDPDEANALTGECANGQDDDRNGQTDFPDDPGCASAADAIEAAGAVRPPACRDGVDSDGDGRVDLDDRGCEGPDDDDEADPGAPPACDDGVDNNANGRTDWPDEPGCAARGDGCERDGYGFCGAARCVDLATDAHHCGACDHACPAGVACEGGLCGHPVFEGVQRDLPAVALDGWALCHRSLYADTADLGGMLAACSGRFVLFACRPVDAPAFSVAAMGLRAEVFHNTGDRGDLLNVHNGVGWYFSGNASLGFTAAGTRVRRDPCDTEEERASERLCWHTQGNRLRAGWRCGVQTQLNGARDWERVVYHAP